LSGFFLGSCSKTRCLWTAGHLDGLMNVLKFNPKAFRIKNVLLSN
jgi:hypothetical protein